MRLIVTLLGVIVAVLLFGSGWLLGRRMPAHRYERFGTSYLLDPTNGKVCDPMFKATEPSIYEKQGVLPGSFPAPPPGFTIIPIKEAYPPPCSQ